VCTRRVFRSLTVQNKTERKAVSSKFLAHFKAKKEPFLPRTVTTDETSVHHFEPETKRQSMERHQPQSPQKKKPKSPSVGKVMVTVFRDCEKVILVDVMPKGETINSEAQTRTLMELRKSFKELGLIRIQQKSCFSMTMEGCTQV
jgi:hypothetical protein